MTKQEHLLSCLSEECCEVGHRVSKALRFGLDEIQPGQPLTNAERISQELNDLIAVAEMLEESGAVPRNQTLADIDRKKAKVETFLRYAEECGVLSADHH